MTKTTTTTIIPKAGHPAPNRTNDQYVADKLAGRQPIGKPIDAKN